jgi:hypothetical protein
MELVGQVTGNNFFFFSPYQTFVGHLQFLSANPTEPTSFADTDDLNS